MEEKKLRVISDGSLRKVIDEANSRKVMDIVQVFQTQDGEFHLIYRG